MTAYARPRPADLAAIPESLRSSASWIVWREEPPRTPNAKPSKIPVNPSNLTNASTVDPTSWTSFASALDRYTKNPDLAGVGIVFSSTGLAGIDIDNCRDPDTGKLEDWASDLVRMIDSYAEVSPSQRGVKIFLMAKVGDRRSHFEFSGHEVEIYDHARYFAVTGQRLPESPVSINDRQKIVDALLPPSTKRLSSSAAVDRSADKLAPLVDEIPDDELLRRIERSAQGEKFKSLMAGSTTGYAGYFAASGALCTILAAWTRLNRQRVDSIYRTSGLVTGWEHWWDEGRPSRGERTISESCALAASGGWLYDPTVGAVRFDDDSDMERVVAMAQHIKEYSGADNSDIANAERFVFLYGDRVRYCPPRETWYVWDGQRWQRDDMRRVETYAARVAASIWIEASFATGDDRTRLFSWAKSSAMHGKLKAMLACAAAHQEICVAQEAWDADPWLLNCENGTYELINGKFREHRKADLISCLAPVRYQEDAPHNLFDDFFYQLMKDDTKLTIWAKSFLGYCVSGDSSKQAFGLFQGPSGTGKSTLLTILHETLGPEYSGTVRAESLFEPSDRESQLDFNHVARCRFVTASEGIEGKRLPENFIKALTGGERISMREMYVGATEFKPKFKLILGTNFKPTIKESGNAIWRRMIYVPFNVKIEKPNLTMADTIVEKERSGVLSWLLEGFALQKAFDRFPPPPQIVSDEIEDYRKDEDIVGDFIAYRCTLDESAVTSFRELYSAFCKYRIDSGDKEKYLMSAKAFANRLDDHDLEKTLLGGGEKARSGVRLK